MESFRFTLFNDLTLLLMAVTISMAVLRLRRRTGSRWPLGYYAVLLGYTFGFQGGLNPYAVVVTAAAGLLPQFHLDHKAARGVELAGFAYILWRALGLILLWQPCFPFCA
ncbi:MAG TPA: hypothetical protein VG672_02270 [Bryobacteraceae bacterium]|nr:hypothetical protein [Bryobacteraceae bacterium]